MPLGCEPVPLTEVPLAEIRFLLARQTEEWRSTLLADFHRIAQRTLFLAELRALAGFALVNRDGKAAGYACHVTHDGGAEVSGFYVDPAFRGIDANTHLLRHLLEWLMPGIERISMAPGLPHEIRISALPVSPTVYPRVAEAASVSDVCRALCGNYSNSVDIRPWDEAYQEEAAALIPAAYSGHVEAGINWFGRSVDAARDFLEGLIHSQISFPFLPEGSLAAIHRDSGKLCGFQLASHAMPGVAHADLLCVAPWAAAYRLGNRLSRETCLALDRIGYHTVTLSRGTTDGRLNRFYGRMGFVKRCDQPEYAWGTDHLPAHEAGRRHS